VVNANARTPASSRGQIQNKREKTKQPKQLIPVALTDNSKIAAVGSGIYPKSLKLQVGDE